MLNNSFDPKTQTYKRGISNNSKDNSKHNRR